MNLPPSRKKAKTNTQRKNNTPTQKTKQKHTKQQETKTNGVNKNKQIYK